MSNDDRAVLIFNKPIRSTKNIFINQDVTLSLSDNVLTVTSNQERSTPGIMITRKLLIKKGESFEFVVKGKNIGDSQAFLWGDLSDDHNTRITAISDDTMKYLPAETDSVSVVVGGFSKDKYIRLGVLMKDPEIGHSFEISGYAVLERKSVHLDSWRIVEMPNNLMFDSKNTDGEWKYVTALQKRT